MWRPFVLGAVVACAAPVDVVKLGDETFANVCARCHGQDGTGGVAVLGTVQPRDLSDPAWQASVGDGQIEAIIITGKTVMPAFQSALSHARIQAVVKKVRRLVRKETP